MWIFYAIMASIIWGLSYTLDERLFRYHVSPFTLLAVQGWVAGILFTVLAYFTHWKADWLILSQQRPARLILFAALMASIAGNFFITASIQAKNATFAAIIENSYPIYTLLFAYLLFKQNQFNLAIEIGGSCIILGVLIISIFGQSCFLH